MRIHPAHTVPGTASATGTVRIAPIAVPMPRCSATLRVLACWGCRAIHNPISIHEERAVKIEASPATRAIVAATAARTLGELFQESVAEPARPDPRSGATSASTASWPRCRQTSTSTSSPSDSTGPSNPTLSATESHRCGRRCRHTQPAPYRTEDAATSRGTTSPGLRRSFSMTPGGAMRWLPSRHATSRRRHPCAGPARRRAGPPRARGPPDGLSNVRPLCRGIGWWSARAQSAARPITPEPMCQRIGASRSGVRRSRSRCGCSARGDANGIAAMRLPALGPSA